MHLFRIALPTFNANPEGGVFLMSSSIAGSAVTGSSLAYAVSKAAGDSVELFSLLRLTWSARAPSDEMPSSDEMPCQDAGIQGPDKCRISRSAVD